MRKTRILFSILIVAAMLISALLLVACSDDGELVTKISSVELKDGRITLKATLDQSYADAHAKDTLYILALPALQPSGALDGAYSVAESKAKTKMTFKFSLENELGGSRIADAFVLAEKNGEKFSALTEPFYISNPESLAEDSHSPAATYGIKGLLTADIPGAELLGGEHILIEAEMDKLILEDYSPDAVRFNFGNLTYFYNKDEVERLDKLIEDAELAGLRIYFRTILSYDAEDESEGYAPDFLFISKKQQAEGYLPDLSSERTVRYIKAFYAFLASRYNVSDYIIGEQVNNYSKYCNADKLTSEEFEEMYAFWARISNQVLKSVNSSAKIYVSTDHNWKSDGSGGLIGSQAFLSRFADSAKKSGDYDYAVALNLGEGDDLPALLKGSGYDYSKLGVTNLSELSDFIDKSEMRYKSERRNMIIDGLALDSDISGKNRAAYYTFAYYAAVEQGFGAFIYSDTLYGEDHSREDLYFAFLMCGSSMNSQLSGYTDKLPDAHIPDFNQYISNNLKYIQSAKTEIHEQVAKNKKAFPVSLSEFAAVGSTKNLQGRLEGDRQAWSFSADLDGFTGAISSQGITAEDIIGSHYVGITLDDDIGGHTLGLIIKNDSSATERHTFIGECKTDGGEATYYFDISEFSKGVNSSDSLCLVICLLPDGDGDATVEICELALYGASPSATETVVIIVAVVIIAAVLVGLIVLLVVKRKKKRSGGSDAD